MSELDRLIFNQRLLQDTKSIGDSTLKKFQYLFSRKCLKKENLRAQIIRALKRALRQISDKVKPPIRTKLHSFSLANEKAVHIWNKISEIFFENPLLREACHTESGPMPDGKHKPKCLVTDKSYNKHFCKSFFTPECVRHCFSYYIELVFVPFDPKSLCDKFKFLCCEGKTHNFECLEKWRDLKMYLSYFFIWEIDLQPVEQNDFISLPSINFCIDEFN